MYRPTKMTARHGAGSVAKRRRSLLRQEWLRPLAALSVGALLVAGPVFATTLPTTTTPTSGTTTMHSTESTDSATASKSPAASTAEQQRLANIKSKGNAEIARRLTQLNRLSSLINSATKISASDKSTLTAEVTAEISGLTSLQTQLNSETILAAAIIDAKSIFSEYRVYALITPKVHLIKVADDQQVNEVNLTALATKLQARLTTAKSNGKDVAALEAVLAGLNAKVAAAQAISSAIEAGVIGLQPADYNNNHSVLDGDMAQLKTAHTDNQAAYDDAKTIVAGIKNL